MVTKKKTKKKTKTKDEKPRDPKTLADPFVFATAAAIRYEKHSRRHDDGWAKIGRHRPTRSIEALRALGLVHVVPGEACESGNGYVELTGAGCRAFDAVVERRRAARR